MFCNQCQEALNNEACTVQGVCGIQSSTVELQDLLVYLARGISFWAKEARMLNMSTDEADMCVVEALFSTITNVNFDDARMIDLIENAILTKENLQKEVMQAYKVANGQGIDPRQIPESALWTGDGQLETMLAKGAELEDLLDPNEDLKSLKKLLLYGAKGIAAYADHAAVLQFKNGDIFEYIHDAMNAIGTPNLTAEELIGLIMRGGKIAVDVMALLDEANVTSFGTPEVTMVSTSTEAAPAILVSGHDLLDLQQLLEQTADRGIHIYTHGEMLPAHSYPELKAYPHLKGHFGGAWYNQRAEFEAFGGAILMTTNCIQKPKASYQDRIYTTGLVAFEGVAHIPSRPNEPKDYSNIIAKALELGPIPATTGKEIPVGFNHRTLLSLADKIVEAVQSGAIKKFVVLGGCDGRQKERGYYTDFAANLAPDTAILTAGCAKYRYNHLDLGMIGDIPKVIDAGQCNDSYSLAVTALKLKEVFGLDDINDLPIEYNIAWYEQKAVAVLLALLHLGVKGIKLGPTLPAFISPGVLNVLVDTFDLSPITNVEQDLATMAV